MTGSIDVMPKTTEQNLIVCIGKSEAKITNDKRLRSVRCTVEATECHKASCSLSATAVLLVLLSHCVQYNSHFLLFMPSCMYDAIINMYPNINRGTYVPACVPATVWHTMSPRASCRGKAARACVPKPRII